MQVKYGKQLWSGNIKGKYSTFKVNQATTNPELLYEPAHDKTTIRLVWPAKTQISLYIRPV